MRIRHRASRREAGSRGLQHTAVATLASNMSPDRPWPEGKPSASGDRSFQDSMSV